MSGKIYITGHRNPDSDSICSAIAYSQYKRDCGFDTVPVRLGKLNRETEFILDYFNIGSPRYLETVRLSVEDLKYDKLEPLTPNTSLKIALDKMGVENTTSMPVVNSKGRLEGMVSTADIIKTYIDIWDGDILGESKTTIDNIVETLEAETIYLGRDLARKSRILVLAMEEESAKKHIRRGDICICGDREEIQYLALDSEISLLIITGGLEISKSIIEKARKERITLIRTGYDTFMTSRIITQSIPVDYVMTRENLVYFKEEDFVEDMKIKMAETRYRGYPVVDHNMKVKGMVSRYHIISENKKKVILVDHNERNQSVDGLEDAKILEIIDHHRVADVFTGHPIYFRNEPVGSTATIIGHIMEENNYRPSKEIAGIICGAIISDTLLLRSPTSTSNDRYILEKFGKYADLDIEEFAMSMFRAGTSLAGKSPKELLNQDAKKFVIGSKDLVVAQVFTMDLDNLESIRGDLLLAMDKIREDKDYDCFILMFTDIFKEGSEILLVGDRIESIGKVFKKEVVNNAFFAPGVVSRKKQLIPPITDVLSQ